MNRFDHIFTKVSEKMALYSGGIILIAMVAYVTANVFARYILGVGGVTGVYEYVGILLVPLVCLALSYSWYESAYISVNLLQKKLNI
jgi:TRAP-type C4-dicarboxylate transport system permease small subunit